MMWSLEAPIPIRLYLMFQDMLHGKSFITSEWGWSDLLFCVQNLDIWPLYSVTPVIFKTFCEIISNWPKRLTSTLQIIFCPHGLESELLMWYLITPRYFLVYFLHIRTCFHVITLTLITTQPENQEVSIAYHDPLILILDSNFMNHLL